jgi:hypothetical protein
VPPTTTTAAAAAAAAAAAVHAETALRLSLGGEGRGDGRVAARLLLRRLLRPAVCMVLLPQRRTLLSLLLPQLLLPGRVRWGIRCRR